MLSPRLAVIDTSEGLCYFSHLPNRAFIFPTPTRIRFVAGGEQLLASQSFLHPRPAEGRGGILQRLYFSTQWGGRGKAICPKNTTQ